MNPSSASRRSFLRRASATSAWLGAAPLFRGLPAAGAEESRIDPAMVKFGDDIEPMVRLLEETPRERLLEEVAQRIRKGATSREIMTALLLAGVRNIQPRPVGFKFHAVLVVHSAHLASLNSPDADRWLPVFWALDQFKASQERDVKEGNWTMAPVDEKAVPAGEKARQAFTEAMDSWDEAKADAAVAGLSRTCGAQEVFDLFCRYGARDFRDIGHKIIYTANSWRMLQHTGWRHSEPVLRSLAYAMLEHEEGNPATREAPADMAGRWNAQLLKKINPAWRGGSASADGMKEMLGALRQGSDREASEKAVELLNRGVAPASLWDAVFQNCSELLMRKPGIITLHASTTANAMHFAFRQTSSDETRRFLLLQAVAFATSFRDRGDARQGILIEDLKESPVSASPEEALAGIFEATGKDNATAASRALSFLRSGDQAAQFTTAAQRLIYMKGTDSHDYKFSSAVMEDYRHISPGLRDAFLAASTYWLKGSTQADSPLVARTRQALG